MLTTFKKYIKKLAVTLENKAFYEEICERVDTSRIYIMKEIIKLYAAQLWSTSTIKSE